MSESKSKKNQKSCILTLSGQQKLRDAYGKLEETPSQTELAQKANIDRFVVSKILHNFLYASDSKPQKPVTYKSLSDFCTECLSVDLDESDFENPPKIQPQPSDRQNKLATDDSIVLESDGGNFQEQFKNALCELNYINQKSLFEKILNSDEPAVSFLIFGKPDHGQRWLVNLLKYKIPYHTSAKPISIVIKPYRSEAKVFWRTLADNLGISVASDDIDSLIKKIVEALYTQWQSSTVILVIHNINYMTSGLQQFLKFWECLVEKVNDAFYQDERIYYRLVLFLIDNQNSKSQLGTNLSLRWQQEPSKPDIPLALEEIEPFEHKVVKTWAGIQSKLLLQGWKSSESIEEVMQRIVPKNNPQPPIFVFREICHCFELDWGKIEAGLGL